MSVWAIVVAAGSGTRFGGPKQLEKLGDKRVIDWSCEVARKSVDGLLVVTSPEMLDEFESSLDVDLVVVGGDTRSASVRAGLAALPAEVDIVTVHDAARPMASSELFAAVIAAVRNGADGAIPGVPVSDTIKRVSGEHVETVDRADLVAVQTPQAFDVAALREAHETGPTASDDAAVLESIGRRVVIVPGEAANAKITTQYDLRVARALVKNS